MNAWNIMTTNEALARVLSMSLHEVIVPLEWKEANIIPLFKSVNDRPVTLT